MLEKVPMSKDGPSSLVGRVGRQPVRMFGSPQRAKETLEGATQFPFLLSNLHVDKTPIWRVRV